MTNASGNYLFSNLPPGEYYVVFDISTADNADLLIYTSQDVDNNVSDDLDSDPAIAGPSIGQTAPTDFLYGGESNLSLDAGLNCNIEVEAGTGLTICNTATVDLTTIGASITPTSLGANWTTSGSGVFDDTNTSTGVFGVAITYTPSAADLNTGEVTLTLTTNDPGGLSPPSTCDLVSDEVLIMVLKVDCGTFPWDGNN